MENKQFLLFSQCFPQLNIFSGVSKCGNLLEAISPYSHCVFKILYFRHIKTRACLAKGKLLKLRICFLQDKNNGVIVSMTLKLFTAHSGV